MAVTSAKKKVGMGQTIATILRDHIVYRKQIIKLAGSDLRRTYRASALGWAWAVIKPLVTIFSFTGSPFFGRPAQRAATSPATVCALADQRHCAVVLSEMLTLGTECILRNRYLVTKNEVPGLDDSVDVYEHLEVFRAPDSSGADDADFHNTDRPHADGVCCSFRLHAVQLPVLRDGRCLPPIAAISTDFRIWSSRSSRQCSLAFGHPVGGRLDARQKLAHQLLMLNGHVYLQRLPQLLHL